MALRIPHLVVPALLATALATACSSKAPPPQAFVQVQATNTTTGTGLCNFNSEIIPPVIGSDISDGGLSGNPVRVPSGSEQGGTVSITCSVAPSGSNFNIALNAEIVTTLTTGGSLTITGTVNSTSGASGDISAIFVAATNTYTENDCSINFIVMPPGGPVAPGRIWGQLSCPNAMSQSQNANATPTTCAMQALFVFENCSG